VIREIPNELAATPVATDTHLVFHESNGDQGNEGRTIRAEAIR
jgi:hypothetical protein